MICTMKLTADMTWILAFWEGNEMDFELKKLLHDEMGMVRIDLSDKIDEFWLSKIRISFYCSAQFMHHNLLHK